MTVFDYIVVALLTVSAAVGAWRGLVSEVIALVAWIAAALAAWLYGSVVATWMEGVIAEPFWRTVAGHVLVFFTVMLLAAALRFLLRELLRIAGLGPADRLFGTFFGVARGVTIACVLVLLGGLAGMANEPWWRNALLSPPLETAVLAAKPWLPEWVADRVRFR